MQVFSQVIDVNNDNSGQVIFNENLNFSDVALHSKIQIRNRKAYLFGVVNDFRPPVQHQLCF